MKIDKNLLVYLNIGLFVVLFFAFGNFSSGQTQGPPGDAGQVLKVRADGALILDTSDNDKDVFTNNDANKNIIIAPTGNLGINNFTPARKLSVNGNIEGSYIYALNGFIGDISARYVTSDIFGNGTGNFSFPAALGIGYNSVANLPASGLYVVGSVGVGVQSPDAKLHILNTGEQLRLGYDASNRTSFTVDNKGQLTIASSNNATTTVSNPTIFSRSVSLSGIAAPTNSSVGQGRIYFDSSSNKFKISENGGAYSNLMDSPSPYLINGGGWLYTSSTVWNVSMGTSTFSTAKLQVANTNDSILRLARLNGNSYEVASTTLSVRSDDSFIIQNQGYNSLILRDQRMAIGGQEPSLANLTVFRTSNNDTISALSGSLDSYTSLSIGRTSPELRIAIVDTGGRPVTDPPPSISLNNDAVFKMVDASRRIHFSAGASPMLTVASSTVGIGITDITQLTSGTKLIINGSISLLNSLQPSGAVPNGTIYYDNGLNKFRCYENSVWTNCIGGNGGGITGSGVSGQITFWNGTNSVSGSNNLFWDSTNSRLGVGTVSTDQNYKITTSGGGIKADANVSGQPAGYFNNANANGYGLIVNAGNVGIGTITPAHALQINKNNGGLYLATGILDSGNTNIFFGGNGTFNDSWMRINYSGANWSLGVDRNININNMVPPNWSNIITFGLDGNARINGSLGIGTVPSTALDVNGTAQATTMKMSSFQLISSPGNGKVLTSNATGIGTWQIPSNAFWNQETNSTSSYVYPTAGDSIRMRLGTYQSFDYDEALNNMGFYWNAYWDNVSRNYKFKNTIAWAGTAARFSGTGYGIAYDMASGSTDPVSWIRRMAIDSIGMTLENSGDLILHSTSSPSFDPGQIKFVKSNGAVVGKIYTWGDDPSLSVAGVYLRADENNTAPQFGVYPGGYVRVAKGWDTSTLGNYTLEVGGTIGATSMTATGLTITGSATVQGSNVCRADGVGCPSSQAAAKTQCPPRRVLIDFSNSGMGDEFMTYDVCTINYGFVELSNVAIHDGSSNPTLQGYLRAGSGPIACSEFGFSSALEGSISPTQQGNSCSYSGGKWGPCGLGFTVGSLTCNI